MKTVYISDRTRYADRPNERMVVARLDWDGERYLFSYTRGVKRSHFLLSWECQAKLYHAQGFKSLPPVLSIRRMNRSRRDLPQYLRWMGLDAPDEMAELAISGGIKATDYIETLPLPERTPDGRYLLQFFTRGLTQTNRPSLDAARRLSPGDRLRPVMDDSTGTYALFAEAGGDAPAVGYLPRLFTKDAGRLLERYGRDVQVEVQRVNPEAALSMVVLCTLTCPWPEGFEPFDGEDDFISLARPDAEDCTDERCVACRINRELLEEERLRSASAKIAQA